MNKEALADTLAEIKLRDDMAMGAMRSLLLIAAKTESMSEIAVMAYRVADAMCAARQPGVAQILEVYGRLAGAEKPREKKP